MTADALDLAPVRAALGANDVFLFGTLLDDGLREVVLGRAAEGVTAILPQSRVGAEDGEYPALVADGEGAAHGMLLWDLSDREVARLHFYEAVFGYRPEVVTIRQGGGAREALAYRAPQPAPADAPVWSFPAWKARWGAATRIAAREIMSFAGRRTPAEVARLEGTIATRAWAAARAGAETPPAALRSGTERQRVRIRRHRRPYTAFFAVTEADLRHPRFGGGQSDELTRAAFVMGDAVTVLPYDPARDRVMLVEQFRFGPFARGDRRPWCLEPIAGRIDPGETAEEAARREAEEEAKLTLGRLVPIAAYYPSPGAVTEHLHTFLALADLPEGAEGISGNPEEGEDIRSHVMPFDRMMALIETGEINTGPLIASAFWLATQRSRGAFA